MTREEFLSRRQPDWQRFEQLLSVAERTRTPKWSGKDAAEFSRLFRSICYDLSFVSAQDWGKSIGQSLNGLVARGHNCFYRTKPVSLRAILEMLFAEFPRLLRSNIGYFLVALILFVVPGGIAAALVVAEPSMAARMLPEGTLRQYDMMYSEEVQEERKGVNVEAMMTGFYVRNNVGIAFRCFATGILYGIGTVFFLIYNSIAIGTVMGYMIARGHSERFFSFVVSHGSFELTAIVIAGAAGLVIGHALVHPGQLSRRDALRERGLIAIKLALGAGAMLGIAALIEGFWSPSEAPNAWKYSVGSLLWLLVIVYLAFGGRESISGVSAELEAAT